MPMQRGASTRMVRMMKVDKWICLNRQSSILDSVPHQYKDNGSHLPLRLERAQGRQGEQRVGRVDLWHLRPIRVGALVPLRNRPGDKVRVGVGVGPHVRVRLGNEQYLVLDRSRSEQRGPHLDRTFRLRHRQRGQGHHGRPWTPEGECLNHPPDPPVPVAAVIPSRLLRRKRNHQELKAKIFSPARKPSSASSQSASGECDGKGWRGRAFSQRQQ